MKLWRLSTRAMLVLSEYWLQQPFIRSHLRAHDLGLAVRIRLREIYGDLTELYAPHLVYGLRNLELAGETPEELQALSLRVYHDLEQRLAGERDPQFLAELYELVHVLFPDGPTGPSSLPALARARTSDRRQLDRDQAQPWFTRLRTVPLSETTLMDAYRAWAAVEDHASWRARKHGQVDASGRTIGAASKIRDKWIRVARALHTAVALLPWDEGVRRQVRELLAQSIETITAQAIAGGRPDDADTESDETLPEGLRLHDPYDDEDTLEFDEHAFDPIDKSARPADAAEHPA